VKQPIGNNPSKVIAGSLGLTAFAIAVVAGLAAGNPSTEVLTRALVCMAICYALGMVLGAIGEHTMQEHVRQYIAARPVIKHNEPVMEVGEFIADSSPLTSGGKPEEKVSAG